MAVQAEKALAAVGALLVAVAAAPAERAVVGAVEVVEKVPRADRVARPRDDKCLKTLICGNSRKREAAKSKGSPAMWWAIGIGIFGFAFGLDCYFLNKKLAELDRRLERIINRLR
jgi:hypothetical protein